MAKPKISVVIPTYQEEKYIESTLKSLRNQDYAGRYEIIVADGNSKDGTVKVARKYADKVVIVKRRGVSAGRNEGAKAAEGEILVFVDADTTVLNNFLRTVDEAFKNRKVIAASSPVMPERYRLKELMGCLLFNELMLKASLHLKFHVLIGNSTAVRKSAFEKVKGFDERLNCLEDMDFAERLSKLGGVFVFMENTMVFTSVRRVAKWGVLRQLRAWPFGYIDFKLLKRVPDYRPVR